MTAAILAALAAYLGAIEVAGRAGLLEGEAGIYVVHVGEVDDRATIRLLECFATARRRYARQRGVAVLAASRLEPRYMNILGLIGRAVPLALVEIHLPDDGQPRCMTAALAD